MLIRVILFLFVAISAYADTTVVVIQPAAVALTCQQWAAYTAGTANYINGNRNSQKLNVTGAIEICKVKFKMYSTGGDSTVKVQIWTDEAKAGTKYGSDSNTVSVTDTSDPGTWYDFTFTTNPSVPTSTDVFVHAVYVNEGVSGFRFNVLNGTTGYSDTNYDYWRDGVDTNYDLDFEVWTMQ